MSKKQSKALTEFYRAWLHWQTDGAKLDDPVFCRKFGLCAHLHKWCVFVGIDIDDCTDLDLEMSDQFAEKQLNRTYPFNRNGPGFRLAFQEGTQHLNEARIQWVRDHANQETKAIS
jgi:hypothetical protein